MLLGVIFALAVGSMTGFLVTETDHYPDDDEIGRVQYMKRIRVLQPLNDVKYLNDETIYYDSNIMAPSK